MVYFWARNAAATTRTTKRMQAKMTMPTIQEASEASVNALVVALVLDSELDVTLFASVLVAEVDEELVAEVDEAEVDERAIGAQGSSHCRPRVTLEVIRTPGL